MVSADDRRAELARRPKDIEFCDRISFDDLFKHDPRGARATFIHTQLCYNVASNNKDNETADTI